jgi:Cu(I)/Ag(I) efflux system membrane fusion protein
MPGEALYQVSDLSAVWVVADVFEQDMGLVKTGTKASSGSTPTRTSCLKAKVTYVYPTLQADTRTMPVRVELANPGLLLKPGMFAQMELQVSGKAQVDRAGVGGDRQWYPANGAGPAQGGPFRAA